MIFNDLLKKNYNNNKEKYNKIIFSIDSYLINTFKGDDYTTNIKYKFFYAKNILRHKYIDHDYKELFIELFNTTQRQYFGLLKMKQMWKYKTTKDYEVYTDLNCVELCEIHDKYKITLLDNHRKFTFTYYDLIKIINNALAFSDEFYITPIQIKNPYNNILFTDTNLYIIYLSILESNMKMPLLFERFFKVNFNIEEFHLNNDFLIREHIINNYINIEQEELGNYILKMLQTFNKSKLYDKNKIIIDKSFPFKTLLDDMSPFVKSFLQSEFSVDRHIRSINKKRYMTALTKFKRINSCYGRKIRSLNIHNMYYISKLYYTYNITYRQEFVNYIIPLPHMLNIKENYFFYPINTEEHNSIFFYYEPLKNRDGICNNNISKSFTTDAKNPFFTVQENDIINRYLEPMLNNISGETKSIYDVLLFNDYFNDYCYYDTNEYENEDLEDGSSQYLSDTNTNTETDTDTDTDIDIDTNTDNIPDISMNHNLDISTNTIISPMDISSSDLATIIWNDMSNIIGNTNSITINEAVIYPSNHPYNTINTYNSMLNMYNMEVNYDTFYDDEEVLENIEEEEVLENIEEEEEEEEEDF